MGEFIFNWTVRVGLLCGLIAFLNAITGYIESPFVAAGLWVAVLGPTVRLYWLVITGQVKLDQKDVPAPIQTTVPKE